MGKIIRINFSELTGTGNELLSHGKIKQRTKYIKDIFQLILLCLALKEFCY